MAIGSSIRHVVVVRPSTVVSSISSPVAAAVVDAGTVMWNSNVALSEGWLLDGYHVIAPDGWFTVKITPSCECQPRLMNGNPGSSIGSGVPE